MTGMNHGFDESNLSHPPPTFSFFVKLPMHAQLLLALYTMIVHVYKFFKEVPGIAIPMHIVSRLIYLLIYAPRPPSMLIVS